MGKRPSLIYQVDQCLTAKFQPGTKKHPDKKENKGKPDPNKIYSYRTLEAYKDCCGRFVRWCKETYSCRWLEECHDHAQEYLQIRRDTVAPSTIHQDAAALAKLFGCEATAFGVALPKRKLEGFTKNRSNKGWEGHYSKKRHEEITILAEGAGLRRCEMLRLKGEQIVMREDQRVWIENVKGKGGKIRDVLVVKEYQERVLKLAEEAREDGRDWLITGKIPGRAPIHAARGDNYAWSIYREFARPLDTLEKKEKYFCRGTRTGEVFDKSALSIVSHFLGHERLTVTINYLCKR